ncbi:MAG TPA: MFS transporter [Vicinamibacteria bacterium]|nr:MFS transporter [Vicinamibacteria bacterium]
MAQSLGSAGFLLASTVSPLVGAQLGGGAAWTGTPAAVYQAGAALLAYVWGLAMDRLGRRPTLALGVGLGALGAVLASVSVARARFPAFLAGVACMGMAFSALQLGRFVAAEVSAPSRRARALSTVVFGGTVGAVLGALLVGPAGAFVRSRGVDELAGPYLASAVLLALVSGLLLVFLRPEPRDVATAVADVLAARGAGSDAQRALVEIIRQPGARLAVVTLVLAQAIMVMLMVVTGVHMKDHAHALHAISLVIAAHVVGMYALSVLSGRLTDARGARGTIGAGALVLLLSCLLAPLSPGVVPLVVSLFLLGWGWNLCYVAGSALLSSQLRPAERARVQGLNDLLMGSASAAGALGSGVVFAAIGYRAMALVSAAASLALFLLALSFRELREQRALAPAGGQA